LINYPSWGTLLQKHKWIELSAMIKAKMRYHYLSIRMVKLHNTDNTKCWQRRGASGTPVSCWQE
jgi:hypothetical protein